MTAPLQSIDVGVTFTSRNGSVEAIRKIDFELGEQEILAIVGPSGCGKSTLFNVIAGLLPASRGQVRVDGKRVGQETGHVGYMLQKDLLLPWRSVIDNVMLGLIVRGAPRATSHRIAQDLIRTYGLEGFENAKPSTLSGGMRQRVAIMRTLAFDPSVILLDEPFSAVDFQTRLMLQADVKRIIRERRKSAILVTHDIGEAITMADRVLVLTQRPASLRAIHEIHLSDASRDPVLFRSDPKFGDYFSAVWRDLENPSLGPVDRTG